MSASRLLSVGVDAKTIKGETHGYLTGILYLAPADVSGRNLCPDSTPGCREACLYTAGRGVFASVAQGRIKRSHRFRQDRDGFMRDLVRDVAALVRKAERMGLTPLVRLNGTSDVPWENVPVPLCPGCDNPDCAPDGRTHVANIMALFPNVQFYDYTKSYIRMLRYLRVTDKPWPANYSLTFSRSECNDAEACNVLRHGGNVSVVFSTPRGAALPETWHGFPVVDGDVDDARPSDAHGVVVGLRAKGRARRDRSGFVVAV